MKTFLSIILIYIAAGATVMGQSAFLGLRAGISTRPEVERVLGRPVGEVSPTLIEYAPKPLTGKIFVQYRKNSTVVERFEFICRTPTSGCSDLLKDLKLPILGTMPLSASYLAGDNGRTVNYYPGPDLVAATIDNQSEGSFYSLEPARVALYSRELYEASLRMADRNKADRLVVRSLRFFEGGIDSGVSNDTQFRIRFPREGTRYIKYAVDVAYPDSRRGSPINITSFWTRDGFTPSPLKTLELKYKLDDVFPFYTLSQGLGDASGRTFAQRVGKWTVKLQIEGEIVAVGSFEIF